MSFQDVAGGGTPSYRRPLPGSTAASLGQGHYPPTNGRRSGSSSSNGGGGGGGRGSPISSGSSSSGGGNGGPAPTVLREALLQFQKQVVLFEKLGREVGGPRDDAELRAQLKAQEAVVREVGARLEQQVGAQLRGADASLSKAEKDRLRAEASKMGKDAQRLKARFDNGVRQTQGRVREADLRARREAAAVDGALASAAMSGGGGSGGLQQQHGQGQQYGQQQALLHEDLDEGLLREREEELRQINRSVVKVNEIFRDLGELVARQQEDVDAIEENVERSHAAAKSGLEQVEKAAKHQAGCVIA